MIGFTAFIHQHSRFVHHITQWLFPPRCILCLKSTGTPLFVCDPCQKDLPILPHSCEKCAQQLTHPSLLQCGACLKEPPPFEKVFALFPYEFPVDQLIIKLKFQNQLNHGYALGQLLAKKIITTWYKNRPLPEYIVPVPLHITRLRKRGYNQAIEIANPLSKILKIPMIINGLKRIKPTAAQSALSVAERKRNVARAFTSQHDFRYSKIALIDDVITTGQTVQACCHILKQQGAAEIDVWCCARR